MHAEAAGDRHPLLLPTRKLAGIGIGPLGQAHLGEVVAGTPLTLRQGQLQHLDAQLGRLFTTLLAACLLTLLVAGQVSQAAGGSRGSMWI
jgi:hypothetical protein